MNSIGKKYLGLVTSDDELLQVGQVSPESKIEYFFEVGINETLYSRFILSNFEDDLDLDLWKRDEVTSTWNKILSSEESGNKDESIYVTLGQGEYSIDVYNHEDLDGSGTSSSYILAMDNDVQEEGSNAMNLGFVTSDDELLQVGQVSPESKIEYFFEVGINETLYSRFILSNFEDNLDLDLLKWDEVASTWNKILSSEESGNKDESIYVTLGQGEYSIGVYNYEDLDGGGTVSSYILAMDNDVQEEGSNAVNLGLVTSDDELLQVGQVSPESKIEYFFEVGVNETLYSRFILSNFEDDLDLDLWKWDDVTSAWNKILSSEKSGNKDESIYVTLGQGEYSIDVYNHEDLDGSGTSSSYILAIDNDAWKPDINIDLGDISSADVINVSNQIEVDSNFVYGFSVEEGETIYSHISLTDFEDDLDLWLWEWDDISSEWSHLRKSESTENKDEQMFKVLGAGQYLIDILHYEDLGEIGVASTFSLSIDNQSWLSSVEIPNDPLFSNQWHLFNTGQGTGYDNHDIYAPEAWGLRSSSPNTTVAVIDGGVDLNHEDLVNNLWVNPGEIAGNNIDDDGNGYIDDINGWNFANNEPLGIADEHGTHVAGIIGAEGNNGIGVAGVTWDVNLMSLDVFGNGTGASDSSILNAIYYAVDEGADVINMSLGSDLNMTIDGFMESNPESHDAYLDALNHAVNGGATVIIAVGNGDLSFDQEWISAPAYFSELIDGVVSVASIGNMGQRAAYSNYGSKVTIGAPGGDYFGSGEFNEADALFSTVPINTLYGYMQGTSMAAPVVSGAVALMYEENPSLTPSEIESLLQSSATNDKGLEGFILNGASLDLHEAISQARAAAAGSSIDGTADAVVQAYHELDTAPVDFNSTLTGVASATDISSIEIVNGNGSIDGSALTEINGTAAAVVQAITDLDTDPSNFHSTLIGSADAVDIIALATANGTGAINGSGLTAINGTCAEIAQALTDLSILPNDFDSTLTAGAANATDAIALELVNGNGSINSSALTAINGSAADVVQAIDVSDTDPDNFDSTLSGIANAADIISINANNGNGLIDGSALTAINGTAADVVQAIADLDTEPASFDSTLSAGAANATDITSIKAVPGLNTIDGSNLTAINGSAADVVQAIADLDTPPANFDVTLSAGAENAADITALEAANGNGSINGSALSAINGTAEAVVQAFIDLDNDPDDFDATLSAGAVDATDISAIETNNGTGSIDGSDLTAINGTAAAVVQAIAELDTDPSNFNSNLTGSTDAAAIAFIEAANGIGIIDGSALTEINGTDAAIVQAIADLDTDPTNFNSNLTGAAAATDIASIEADNGNGLIDGSALTAINGTAAAVVQAIADLDTSPANFDATLSAGAVDATDITSIEGNNGNGLIDGSALTAINGTYAEINQALIDLDTAPANFDSTLSAGAETAADITALELANGNGSINGSALTAINGTYAEINQALIDLDTDPTNFDSTLSAGIENAADITALAAANGNGTINGSALSAINGTAAAVVQAFADLGTAPANFDATLSGVASAADIASIEADNGNGLIDGSALTAINGTAAEVVQAITDLDTDPGNFNSKLTAGVAEAVDISSIEIDNGNGSINGSALTEINGTADAVVQAYGEIDDAPVDFNSTLSGLATATDISEIENANGAGTIDGSALTEINGAAADIVQAIADLNTAPADFDSTLAVGAANATIITAIERANGGGSIDGSALTEINGTAAAVVQAITDLDTDPSNFYSTLIGSADAVDIALIEAANGTGSINGSALTAINGTAAAVVQAAADLDIAPTDFGSVITGTAIAADIFTILAANGSGVIDGSSLTDIDGTTAEIAKILADPDFVAPRYMLGGNTRVLSADFNSTPGWLSVPDVYAVDGGKLISGENYDWGNINISINPVFTAKAGKFVELKFDFEYDSFLLSEFDTHHDTRPFRVSAYPLQSPNNYAIGAIESNIANLAGNSNQYDFNVWTYGSVLSNFDNAPLESGRDQFILQAKDTGVYSYELGLLDGDLAYVKQSITSKITNETASSYFEFYDPPYYREGELFQLDLQLFKQSGLVSVDNLMIAADFENSSPTGRPTLAGNFKVGQTITIDSSAIEDSDNINGFTPTYEYSWEVSSDNGRSWTVLTSADATDGDHSYALTSAEVDKQLRGVVRYLDGYGTNESLTSVATDVVANTNHIPTGVVAITGTPMQGETLTADTSAIADVDGLGDFSYQWKSDGVDINGANQSTLYLTQNQVGKAISVTASYTDGYGTNEMVSSGASLIAPIEDQAVLSIDIDATAAIGQSIALPISLDDATGLQAFEFVLAYDSTIFSLPTSSPIYTSADLTSNWTFQINSSLPGQINVAGFGVNALPISSGHLINLNLDVKDGINPTTAQFDLVSASLNEDAIAVSLQDQSLEIIPDSFQVLGVRQLASGLALKLSEAPDFDIFNLYHGQDASQGSVDLRLTDEAGDPVALSAHWQDSSQELFLLSSTPLALGGYSLVIDSRFDGLVSASNGELLDGNGDGVNGDAFSYNYTHQKPEYALSIGNTSRGGGQELSVNGAAGFDPVTGNALAQVEGLPIHLTTAKAITTLGGTLELDSQLLLNSQWVPGADLPDDWTILVTPTGHTGEYQFQASGQTSIQGEDLEVFRLKADVTPDSAPGNHDLYGSTTLIQATLESDQLTGQVFAVDPGLVAMVYSGDTTGNGTISSLDASYVQRVVVGLDSGFNAFDDLNPVLIGDTTGNGTLSSLDASMILQQVVGLPVDSFPKL